MFESRPLPVLMKLEDMAQEMQEPFGYDTHDLPLDELCQRIETNLHEIMIRAEAPDAVQIRQRRRSAVEGTPMEPSFNMGRRRSSEASSFAA